MDAIQIIQRDHRELDRLFTTFDRAARSGDARRQGAIARQLVRELSIHAAIEEEYLYPALREAGLDDGVLDALEEHHAAKVLLSEVEALPARNPRFASKVRVLAAAVRHHVGEEEQVLLPRLEQALSREQLAQLGETLAEAKRAAPTRPHPQAPDTPPGVFVAGSLAALWDRLRDALREGAEVAQAAMQDGARRSAHAVRGMAGQAERRGRRALGAVTEQVAEEAREIAEDTSRRGRELGNGARKVGEQAVTSARKRGRAAAESAREGGRRVGSRAGAQARKAAGRASATAAAARKGARRATRGFEGEPRGTVH